MGRSENVSWPEDQPEHDNIVPFKRPNPEQPPQVDEFDEVILKGLFGEDNVKLILAKAQEYGVDYRVILDNMAESFPILEEISRKGYPIYYVTPDGKSHKIHDGFNNDEPRAV